MPGNQETPSADNPITSSREDRLDRSPIAHEFAKTVRGLDAAEGLVVGVLGPWGSGKSSFVNLMREQFSEGPALTVIDFNPWMFSGSQQLVDFFFKEIAAELRVRDRGRFEAIADGFETYGDALGPLALIPGLGNWWDRSLKAVRTTAKWYKERKGGARSLRAKIAEALEQLDQPIVVVVDDIDRLSTDEIRDIFKLVRLTGSFPNLIYVVAFDRERVEKALEESNLPGRAYLEKIIQLAFDLPAVPPATLRREIVGELDRILGSVPNLRFSESRWPDVFVEIVEPLFGNLRDVTRFALSARPTLEALGGDVDVVDLVALEAVRIFRPEIFSWLKETQAVLTDPGSDYGSNSDPAARAAVDGLLDLAGGDAETVRSLLRRVFPVTRRHFDNQSFGAGFQDEWRREHRLANGDFLTLYFSRQPSEGLIAFRRGEEAFATMSEGQRFGAYLDAIPPVDLEATIQSLEAHERAYAAQAAVPASIELLNRVADIPERPSRGMFDFNRPDLVITRVVLRLLRKLETEQEQEAAARSIYEKLESYSSKLTFVRLIGHEDGVGHKLVSGAFADQLASQLADEVSTSEPARPAREWDAIRVYYWLAERRGESYVSPDTSSVALVRSLFASARSQRKSQAFDSRAVRIDEILHWDGLIKVLGSEDGVLAGLKTLREADGDTDLVNLGQKYKDGWRPKDFMSDDDD